MNISETYAFEFLKNKFHSNHRALVFLSGTQSWAHSISKSFLSSLPESSQKCWVGSIEKDKVNKISNLQIVDIYKKKKIIGTDIDFMIIDSWSGLSPNLLGLASGTLKGGAVLIVLLPDIDNLEHFKDPNLIDFKSKRPYEYEMNNNFLKRLASKIFFFSKKKKDILLLKQKENLNVHHELNKYSCFYNANEHNKCIEYKPNLDQSKVVKAIIDLSKDDKGFICIDADRGRGKTVSLALGALEIIKETEVNIIITAPQKANIKNFFDVLCFDTKKIQFYPVDKIISLHAENKYQCSKKTILIIDEAASFPISILQKIIKIFNKIIFSTTVQGYEGSGRGFIINFKKRLADVDPSYKSITLNTPLRWADHDPMESFFKDLLIMNNECLKINEHSFSNIDNIKVKLIQQSDLLINELLLNKIYSLLVSSHYQTRPNDLRMMLDAPYLRLWIATLGEGSNEIIVGVLLASEEGGFGSINDDLYIEAIIKNKRRQRGNLLSQLMTNVSGDGAWSKILSLRVMRIAVDHSFRNKGVGTNLVQHLEKYAVKMQYSYISVSFGFSSDVYNFWIKQKFKLINIGMHIDKSSGSRNIMFAKSLNKSSEKIIYDQYSRLIQNLIYYKRNYFLEFTHDEWSKIYSYSYENSINHNDDLAIINRFINNELTFENAFPSICRFYESIQANEPKLIADLTVVKSAIESAPRWAIISNENQLSGRKSVFDAVKNELMPISKLKY